MNFKSPFDGIHVPDYAKNYQGYLDGSRQFHNPFVQDQDSAPITDEYRTRQLEYASKQLNRAGGMRMGGRGRPAGMTYAKGAYRGLNKEQAFQKAADQFDEQHRKFEAPYGDHTTRRHSWVPDPKHHVPDKNADWKAVADANEDMKRGIVERGPEHTKYADGSHLQKSKDGSKHMVTPYGTISSGAPTTPATNKAEKQAPQLSPPAAPPANKVVSAEPTAPQRKFQTPAPKTEFQPTPETPHMQAKLIQDGLAKHEAQKKARLEKNSDRGVSTPNKQPRSAPIAQKSETSSSQPQSAIFGPPVLKTPIEVAADTYNDVYKTTDEWGTQAIQGQAKMPGNLITGVAHAASKLKKWATRPRLVGTDSPTLSAKHQNPRIQNP